MPIQKDPEEIEKSHLKKATAFAHARVVEIGCGDGRLTWRYAPLCDRVTGIDLDVEALQAATAACPKDLFEKVSFAQADSLNLPLCNGVFDTAILAWSL